MSGKARERLHRHCVDAVCALEDLHEPVMRGQSVSASVRRYRAIVRGLRATAAKLCGVAALIERDLDSGNPR